MPVSRPYDSQDPLREADSRLDLHPADATANARASAVVRLESRRFITSALPVRWKYDSGSP